jgi:hypothetical protein
MSAINKFGARLTPDLVTADKVPSRTTVFSARPAIQADLWARNGLAPDARLASTLNEHANQAAIYRPKQYFSYMGRLDSTGGPFTLSGVAGSRARWRFAFRSGPHAHGLCAIVAMVEPDTGNDQNSYATLEITNGAGTVVATGTFIYGASPIDPSLYDGGWPLLKQIMAVVDGIPADTELYGTFYDQNYGRLQSCCVFELPTLSENGGYLATNIATNSAIVSTHRQYAAEISNAVWQKGGSQVLNWTRDDGGSALTISSATSTNIIDTTLTGAPTATSPGFTLDMSNKDRLSQSTGVPVTMKVYVSVSPTLTGTVKLVNSSNVAVLTATITSTTPAWVTVTGVLPATEEKYDPQFSCTGASLSLFAISVYEYG